MQSKLIATFLVACFALTAFAAPVAEPDRSLLKLPRVEEEVRAPEPQPGCTLYSCT
ncbi:hypothetical protein C8F01DRAFT_1259818 [Mycena amicta]|nr:hypothetical protein C8F01DRAFT_1259818 [Mycena amicta]